MRMKRLVMGCAAAAVTAGLMAGTAFADDVSGVNVKRLAGDNRYATAAAICQEGYAPMPKWIAMHPVLVSGENYPDALCASAVAGGKFGPILLTQPGSLSTEAENEFVRLSTKSTEDMVGDGSWIETLGYISGLTVVGGESSVSSDAMNKADSYVDSEWIERIAGDSREGTSVAVLTDLFDGVKTLTGFNDTSQTVIVASGQNFADALSISPYASFYGGNGEGLNADFVHPIILTGADGLLSSEAVDAVKAVGQSIKNIVIVGGENSVNENVKAQLGDAYQYTRLAGNDRYETSAKVAQWEIEQGMSVEYAAVATGKNFPDALAGGAFSGMKKSVLLLADEGKTSEAASVLSSKKGEINTLYVYGGEGSVSNATVEAVLG